MTRYKNFIKAKDEFFNDEFVAIHTKKSDYMFRNITETNVDNITTMIVFEKDLEVEAGIELPDKLYWMQCEHGDNIIDLDEYEKENEYEKMKVGKPTMLYPNVKCDGVITSDENKALALLTADCMPVYIADTVNNVFGLIHSGWKGTVRSIAVKAIDKMIEKGAKLENLKIFVGPAISMDAFEVDWDVAEQFTLYMNKNIIDIEKYMYKKGEKYHIDLKGILIEVLKNRGIDTENNLRISDECTYKSLENFENKEYKYHSYRRDKNQSGRNLSLFMKNNK